MKKLVLITIASCLIIMIFGCLSLSAQNVIYVDSAAMGANNGTSWSNAYTNLKLAVDTAMAQGTDTILVAKGTYYPTNDTTRANSFNIQHHLVLLGGYPNGGGMRNWKVNPTILSGDIGIIGDSLDNSNNVITVGAVSDGMVQIDGFTIQDAENGGMYLYNAQSTVKIQHCVIYNNYSYNNAGGIETDGLSDFVGTDLIFTNNVSHYGVGGMYCRQTSPMLTNVLFTDNVSQQGYGGALAVWPQYSQAKITNVVFDNNSAVKGGAIFLTDYGSLTVLNNCVFYRNHAFISGGALYSEQEGYFQMTNCSFEANYVPSSYKGGAIYAQLDGYGRESFINNCIFHDNSYNAIDTGNGSDIDVNIDSSLAISHSLLQSSLPCYDCLPPGTDPKFANAGNGPGVDNTWMTSDDGLRLRCYSPAVNVGVDSAVVGISTDIKGDQRVQDSIVDLGAYEVNAGAAPDSSSINITACNSYTSPSGSNTWTSSGTYMDTIANISGCDSVITIHLTIDAVDTSVTQSGDSLIANANGVTYQWIHCGGAAIPGATSQVFVPTAGGSYAVVVNQGVCGDTSACIAVTGIHEARMNTGHLNVFPNPNNGSFTISSKSSGTFYIINELGQQIQTIRLTNSNSNTARVFGLSNGVYLITGYNHNGVVRKRVVVVK